MNRIETVANMAIIVAAGVVILNNVYGRFVSRGAFNEPVPSLSHRLFGKQLPVPADLPAGRQGTITVFLSKDCHYCRESMGFYRELAKAMASDRACDVKLVALGPSNREKREDVINFLKDQKLQTDGAEVVDFAGLGVSGTPTLVLRDSSQLVRNVWVGLLSGTRQEEVLERVKLLCRR